MPRRIPTSKKAKNAKVHTVMSEFKQGTLHSGSKKGPKVTNRKQAVTIAMSEAGLQKPKARKHKKGQRK